MTAFSTTIAASADDADQGGSTVVINGSNLNANATTQYMGFRFNNVTIPQGATINTATMDLYFVSASFDDPNVTFYGDDVDDAAAFTTTNNDISGRTPTTATASWNTTALGTGYKTTPSIATIVQEIVNRGGWASGNDMVIIVQGASSGSLMRIRAYDSGSGSYATINVDYTASGPQTLTGAYISAGTTLYAGTIAHNNKTLTGAYISAGTTLYAGTIAHNNKTLTGAYITATTALYAGTIAIGGADQTLTGAYITATTALYSGHIYTGPIRLVGMTHHEISELSSTSFQHETPEGDDRLLVVVATYVDTAGINSLVVGGTEGTGNGEFPEESLRGIAIASNGNIYVSDTSITSSRIQIFDADGVYVSHWGSYGTGNGEFFGPIALAIAPDGTVYVTDTYNDRIQYFDADGTYLGQWGSTGTGNGEFDTPLGIAIAPNGTVYVADTLNDRIQYFDADGTYLGQWSVSTDPYGLAVAADGTVYVTRSYQYIGYYTATGTYIGGWGGLGTGNGLFSALQGIAIDSYGDVYAVDRQNYRIQKFSPTGEFITKWGTSGTGDGQFGDAYNLAIDTDNAVYVAENVNIRVQKFNAGLKLNRAYYGTEPMEVGPLVDAGSYYQAFYTLANPTVGSAEVVLTAPTGPDKFMITAMSFVGVETATVDYTGPDAGRAEAETSTTALQISHDRTYPARSLSLWALLYETASTTLTAAANNFHLLTRTLGTLNTALGLRVFPSATSGSQTFGATASPAVTQKITAVLHLEPKLTNLTAGAYISPTTTLYSGTIAHDGFTMYGAYISSTATLYAGQVNIVLPGAYISAGTTLYAGTIEGVAGPDQTLTGVFIGVGLPSAINGAYISPATEFFAGVITTEVSLEGAYIEASTTLYAGTLTGWDNEATGQMWAGTIFNVS